MLQLGNDKAAPRRDGEGRLGDAGYGLVGQTAVPIASRHAVPSDQRGSGGQAVTVTTQEAVKASFVVAVIVAVPGAMPST